MIVIFNATVWEQLLAYVPYPSGIDLPPAIRTELRGATMITRRGSMPSPLRVAMLTPEQFEELDAWLVAVIDRQDGPARIHEALGAVRDARRRAD